MASANKLADASMTTDGVVSSVQEAMPVSPRRRRRFSTEFKREVVQACEQPGMSLSGVALRYGLNANMVRKWVVRERQLESIPTSTATFVPVVAAASAVEQSTATLEIETARGLVRIHGRVDAQLMRVVIESMTAR